jgi:tripartite-type tricarboxylate transporter receptor subunit TctC
MNRRTCAALLAACTLAAAPLAALAQTGWPKAPITVIVPLAAGDGGDTTARAMAELLARELDTPVLVQNKPGAGGALGVQQVIAAKKDGYTLLFTQNSPLTIRRVLEPAAASYDPLRDLAPLAITTRTPSVLVVRKDAPFDTFQELVAYAKKNPGKVHIGNAGPGSSGDLSVQVINSVAETDLLSVPYKGAAPAVTDVIGGQVEGVILALGILAPHLRSGSLKAIAISDPFPELPGVPTLTRLGYRQDILGVWFAWMMPAGTPPEVAQALVPALQKVAKDPAMSARLMSLGIVQDWEPAARVASEIRREYDTLGELNSRTRKN